MYYKLDDDKNVIECDAISWASSIDQGPRRVGHTTVGTYRVSTVFLGLDHGWEGGPLEVFETMVFSTEHEEDQWGEQFCYRYATWEEAEIGHASTVEAVEEAYASQAS